MRMLHVITSLRTGGAEKLMVDLLPRMKAKGHEVDLCVFDGTRTPFYDELERRGVNVIPLGQSVYSFSHIFKLVKLIRQYDIVHTHNTACQYYVAIANLFVHRHIYTTEHNTTNRRRNWMWKLLDKWMYRQYDKIVCISEQTRDNLTQHIGKGFLEKCTIVYNGIDLNRFCVRKERKRNDAQHNTIVMVSAFREQKDQKTLIRAMQWLPNNYVLKLVGGGEERLISECKDLAKDLNVENRIDFMGVRTDIPELLQQADVAVLSSHYEGLSLSSLEGMASGSPFIASDVEGLRDIVGGYGVLFPHEDAKTLAYEIRNLCEDEEYTKEVAKRCQERAKMFDVSVMVRKYLDVYQNTICSECP